MHYVLKALEVPEHVARVIAVEAELEGATLTGHLRGILVNYAQENADLIIARLSRRDELASIGTDTEAHDDTD